MAHILVTDDSIFLRRITCNILKAAGHSISEAANGLECLRMLEQEKPDAIFLDLVMPEMDGLTALKQLRENGNTTPVIILTADIQDSVKEECFQWGAADFLNKPPKEEQVLSALNHIIGNQEDC